jgi:hypothetical protein
LKLIFCCLFKRCELIYARIVYQNIESTKRFLCFGEEVLDVFTFRNIPLDRDGLSAFFVISLTTRSAPSFEDA